MQLFYPLGFPSEKDKTATSYDSINSLTTNNNQYTLLYPDLVQELFDFSLHNSNSSKNNVLSFGGLVIPPKNNRQKE